MKAKDIAVRQDRPGWFSLSPSTPAGGHFAALHPYQYQAGQLAVIVANAQRRGLSVAQPKEHGHGHRRAS